MHTPHIIENYWIHITVTTLFGIVIVYSIATRSKAFWPILVAASFATSGILFGGYAFVDEFLIGCIVLGGLIGTIVRSRSRLFVPIYSAHFILFFVLMIYMIFQSVRGLFFLNDWRMIRWIIYYILLAILLFFVRSRNYPIPNPISISLLITWSVLIYFSLYLAQGVYTEFKGYSRFSTQGISWSGSAYAVLPLLLVMPAVFMLIVSKGNKKWYQWLGWIQLILGMIIAHYYESRISEIVNAVFIFLLILMLIYKNRLKTILLIFIFVVIVVVPLLWTLDIIPDVLNLLDQYLYRVVVSVRAIWAPRHSDLSRYIHFKAPFVAISNNIVSFLFGYGVYSHRVVLHPIISKMYMESLRILPQSIIRTTGIGALVTDTGIVGLFLLIMNFFFVGRNILFQKGPSRIALLMTLTMLFLWLFVSNIQDVVLLYLMIMPDSIYMYLFSRNMISKGNA